LAQSSAGDHGGAVAALEASLRLDMDRPELWVALGTSLAELGRFDEAANALETAVFHTPEDASAWGRLGQARTELGRHREAIPCFEKAVELGFAPWGLWIDMGRSAAEVRDIRVLGRAYEQLREEHPEDAEVLKGKLRRLQGHRRAGRRRRRRARPFAGSHTPSQRLLFSPAELR
jgi:tetratricopeptide (TPR) repeat protein